MPSLIVRPNGWPRNVATVCAHVLLCAFARYAQSGVACGLSRRCEWSHGTALAFASRMTPLLIVEDEDAVASVMERWLGGRGYSVTWASTAEEGLALMDTVHPWVAICDVGLPGHDGLWLADRLRRDYADTAVVLATGRNYLPPAATMRTGIVSYLMKPFSVDQLRTAVADAVQWHQDACLDDAAEQQLSEEARAQGAALQGRVAQAHLDTDADQAVIALFPDREERALAERVEATCLALAAALRMPDDERDALSRAARLHRLCRLAIPDRILQKPEILSHGEMDVVKRAPGHAVQALMSVPGFGPAAQLLRSIRERFDGVGHPDRLVGDQIPLGSRILAVAEAIEAMAHDRPHRPALTAAEVGMELQRCAGGQFDPAVVVAALKQVLRRQAS